MPRRAAWSRSDVRATAQPQLGLITARQLAELGVPTATIYRRSELGGMFSWVLPGLHRVDGNGQLTDAQRRMAALLYGGEGSALTGVSRLGMSGVRAAARQELNPLDRVHVLVPHTRRRSSHGFVQVERTRVGYGVREHDGLAVVSHARAVIDAARRCSDQEAVRALVFEVVQRRFSTIDALQHEWDRAQIRGSRFVRLALEEAGAGARSIPEGDVRRAFIAAGWTRLLFNPELESMSGAFIACPDVYDPDTGVCLELDSREHHFDVTSWEATMARHARMTAYGLAVLHAPPSRAARDMDGLVAEFDAAVTARRGHPAPSVRVRGRPCTTA
jgi:hypothetical protein